MLQIGDKMPAFSVAEQRVHSPWLSGLWREQGFAGFACQVQREIRLAVPAAQRPDYADVASVWSLGREEALW